jgi:hypothetical protein
MARRLSLYTRYILSIIAAILLAILVAYIIPVGQKYVSDKHSFIVNLLVLLFTVVVVERLSSYKALLEARRVDEQRILGFNEVLEINIQRYIQFADAMTRPMNSFVIGTTYERKLSDIAFTDMGNMYNMSLFKFMPRGKKCYQLYFEAAIEIGELINRNITYIYSSHYKEVTEVLLVLAGNNNKLDIQSMYESFKFKEIENMDGQSTANTDIEFIHRLQTGEIKQSVEFIESNNHALSDYARTYMLMKNNFVVIEAYHKSIHKIKQEQQSSN